MAVDDPKSTADDRPLFTTGQFSAGVPTGRESNSESLNTGKVAAEFLRAEAAIAHARSLTGATAGAINGASLSVSERLALSDARFRALVALAGHCTWTLDPQGAVVRAQPAWQAFTGQRYADLLTLGGSGWLLAIHPDDRDGVADAFHAGFVSEEMFEHQCRIRRVSEVAGYEWRHTLMRAAPVRVEGSEIREWVVANTDVTEYVAARDEAESALREREDHYRHAVELNPQIPWTATRHGYIYDVSPRWRVLTGFGPEVPLRNVWREVQHPDDVEHVREAWERSRRLGELLDVEHRIRLADGTYRYMRSRAAPRLDEQGQIVAWYGTTEDVDERRRAEVAEWLARRDAERSRDEAESARRVAESAVAAKGRILAAASHDLRSPLDAIGRYADILENEMVGALNVAQRDILTRMRSAREHLLALVNDVLRAAEAEANEVQFAIDDVDVSTVCQAIDELMAPQADARGIRFECQTNGADTGPIIARADPERLLQILANLVSNALKFTESGGAVFVVASHGAPGLVHIRVSDTGCGIPSERLESVFDPFVQVTQIRPTRAGHDGGVGLGLATSRTLARRMRGDTTVSSAVGVGSVFTVTLPAAQPESAVSGD